MNIFNNKEIAQVYDNYYNTPTGKQIDILEKKAITSCLEKINSKELLELGCGTGHWTSFFSELHFKITAIDIADSMLEIANKKNIPDCNIQKADVNHLPFENESYTLAASITMLEFVDDMDQALKEIFRVIKPDGYLVLGCLNMDSVLGKTKDFDSTFKHARFLTKEEWNKKLSLYGKTEIIETVFLDKNFKLTSENNVNGSFLAIKVQKA